MAGILPIRFQELLQLPNVGVNPAAIGFATLTLESDKYLTVIEAANQGAAAAVVIVDMANPGQPARRAITADSAIMNPSSNILALKAQNQLQVFNMDTKQKLKAAQMDDQVVFWKWLNDTTIGLVTGTAVYHWVLDGPETPQKVFDRHANLADCQVINYRGDASLKWLCVVGIAQREGRIAGTMQLYSQERKVSQVIEGHACAFATLKQPGASAPSTLFTFSKRTATESKLYIIEVAKPDDAPAFTKRAVDLHFPPEAGADFPVAMQVSPKYNIIFLVTKFGYLHLFDLETGTLIYRNRISSETIFVTCLHDATGGLMGVDRKGRVLVVAMDDQQLVPYVTSTLNDYDLAIRLASKANLPGAENLVGDQFARLFQAGDYKGAAKIAADSPRGMLRTPKTIQLFQQAPAQPGQVSPLLQYFGVLLESGKLNKVESIELARPVLMQGRKQLLEEWIAADKLTGSEELGDLLKPHDLKLALRMYHAAEVHPKVVLALAETGQMDKIVAYAQKVNYRPDWRSLLAATVQSSPEAAAGLAQSLVLAPGGALVDVTTVVDLFMSRGMVQPTTSLLLEVLKGNKPEEGPLQTRLLEINLTTAPQVADAILGNEMFSHYDRQRIAQLCEKAGLFQRALDHYTDINDRKRVMLNTHAIDPNYLTEYFARLSVEDTLECLKHLLRNNLRQNLQVVVNIATRYSEHLTPAKVVEMLESFKSYEGLFFYLGTLVNASQDPVVHNKYIEAAARTGQTREVERVCRESSFYDAEKIKEFLKEAKLADQLPLIIVCDRFDFVADLTTYLYKNNMNRYIEAYVQRINPHNTPTVVGALIDIGCNEDYIKQLLMSVRGMCPIERLVEEVEKRHKLKLILPWLESRVQEGNTAQDLHNALAKIYIDSNKDPKKFLQENQFYDPIVVGKYCEKRDPVLAVMAYQRGRCDDELIDCTNRNGLFKLQARYLVSRQDMALWGKVLTNENEFKRQLVDQVVQTALPESNSTEEVSSTVEAFMSANLPNELIELLDKIVLDSRRPEFTENKSLQNLLILTAIRADPSRVMGYINRLNNYDAQDIASVATQAGLYEEAFAAYKKANMHVQGVEILIDHLHNLERAAEFAERIGAKEVFSKLARAFLDKNEVVQAIGFYIKAEDPEYFNEVIYAANSLGVYDDLVKFLKMAKSKVKEPRIESELVFAYAKTNKLAELEELISTPGCCADMLGTGDRCYDAGLFEAAKVLYASTDNYGKLASALVQLKDYPAAIEAAKKANNVRTWKEVNFACVKAGEFDKARTAGLFLIQHPDELEGIIRNYEDGGHFQELIALLERGKQEEGAHMSMLTELAVLYSKYQEDKLMDFIRANHEKINIPKVINWVSINKQWAELTFLYIHYNEYDNAALTIMQHSADAFEPTLFKDVITKVANHDLHYKAIQFFLEEHPLQVNDLLVALTPLVDHARVVQNVRRLAHLPLIRQYLETVQEKDIAAVNEAVNELYVEEGDYEKLRHSVDHFKNFDQIALAKQLETSEVLEFRRIAAYLYRLNQRWEQSVDLSKREKLYKDAIDTAAASGKQEVAEELLKYLVQTVKSKECFTAALYTCYSVVRADVALELAWRNGMVDQAFPFMLQYMRDMSNKVDALTKDLDRRNKEKEKKSEQPVAFQGAHTEDAGFMGAIPQIAYYPDQSQAQFGMMPQAGMPGMPGMGMQPGYGGSMY